MHRRASTAPQMFSLSQIERFESPFAVDKRARLDVRAEQWNVVTPPYSGLFPSPVISLRDPSGLLLNLDGETDNQMRTCPPSGHLFLRLWIGHWDGLPADEL